MCTVLIKKNTPYPHKKYTLSFLFNLHGSVFPPWATNGKMYCNRKSAQGVFLVFQTIISLPQKPNKRPGRKKRKTPVQKIGIDVRLSANNGHLQWNDADSL